VGPKTRGENWSRTHRKTQKTGEQQGWTKNQNKTRGGLVEDE